MERTEDTSFPMWDGNRDMEELLDKPMRILKRESRPRKDGSGYYDVWLVEVAGEGMGFTIPRGNLPIRHERWTMDPANRDENGFIKPRHVLIRSTKTNSGFTVYKIMNWNEDDERTWSQMESGNNVPF